MPLRATAKYYPVHIYGSEQLTCWPLRIPGILSAFPDSACTMSWHFWSSRESLLSVLCRRRPATRNPAIFMKADDRYGSLTGTQRWRTTGGHSNKSKRRGWKSRHESGVAPGNRGHRGPDSGRPSRSGRPMLALLDWWTKLCGSGLHNMPDCFWRDAFAPWIATGRGNGHCLSRPKCVLDPW